MTNEEKENQLIDSASELIRKKIRSTMCNFNIYSATNKDFYDIDKDIPPHLPRFLNNDIYKDKKRRDNNKKMYCKKMSSIAHAVKSATRLKIFKSSLQLATEATFYRKCGSKKIIGICHNLRFSCIYTELQLFQICAPGKAK